MYNIRFFDEPIRSLLELQSVFPEIYDHVLDKLIRIWNLPPDKREQWLRCQNRWLEEKGPRIKLRSCTDLQKRYYIEAAKMRFLQRHGWN